MVSEINNKVEVSQGVIEVVQDDRSLSKLVPRSKGKFLLSLYVLSTIHPMILGYDSLMSGGILNLESYISYFNLTPVTIGLNNAIMWVGQIVVTLTLVQYLCDKYGRKTTIIVGLCCITVGVVLVSAAHHIAMFLIGRFTLGFGGSMTNITAIVLLAELCPTKLRGFLMGMAFSSFLVGALLASGVTYATRDYSGNWNWRVPCIVQAAPEILAVINLFFIPESPRWLLAKGHVKIAREILMIRTDNNEEETSKLIVDFTGNQMKIVETNYHPMLEFFKSRINVHRAFIGLVQALITEMAGSSVCTYYLAILLQQAGLSSAKQRLQANMAMSAWSLFCSCSGSYLFDKIGRRRQALFSLTGMSICFLILGGLIKKFGSRSSDSGIYGTVAVMFLFNGFYSFTFTPLTTLYPPELYPFDMRSAGTTMFSLFNSSFGLVSSFILPIAMSNIGWKYYIVNGCYDIVFIPLVYFFWVETKGVDIEKVDQLFWEHRLNRKHAPQTVFSNDESESVDFQSILIADKA